MEMWKLLARKLEQPWTSGQFWKQRGASPLPASQKGASAAQRASNTNALTYLACGAYVAGWHTRSPLERSCLGPARNTSDTG